jgi:membrane fusion protein (multidrug efflux system)
VQVTGSTASLPGRIEALEVVAVPVPFDGKIESFSASVGQDVAEGQPLAEIRNADLEAERTNLTAELTRLRARVSATESTLIAARLEAAKAGEAAASSHARVDSAQKDLAHQQMLSGKGAASKQSLDKFQSTFDSTSAEYDRLSRASGTASSRVEDLVKELDSQQQLLNQQTKSFEDATAQVASGNVKSPVDGFITARKGEAGDQVTTDVQDLFQIAVNLAQLKVVVTPPPDLLPKVRAGQAVLIHFAEIADPVESKVSEVSAGQVSIEFTSPNAVVKPGMTAQVVISLN